MNITVAASNPDYSSSSGVLFDKAKVTLLQFPEGLGGNYTISNGVTTIGAGAFENSFNLTGVTIPATVTSIGVYAFNDCNSLMNITVAASNPAFSSPGGVLFNKAQATLLHFPGALGGSYTISNGVTTIGEGAFEDCFNLTGVTLPASVTSLGSSAFSYCNNLTAIYFQGNSPTPTNDSSVFAGDNIGVVYYQPGTTGWGPRQDLTGLPAVLSNLSFYGDFAYTTSDGTITIAGYTGSGAVVVIPTTTINGYPVTGIGTNAFESANLTSVTIGTNVTSIGDYAFYNCSSLTSVAIGTNVTSIGVDAFGGCTSLTSVTIPASITSISDFAFWDCTGLTSVTIPASVTSIGNYSFMLCT